MDYFEGDAYREFIYLRTYSRWREDLQRRELWPETVERYLNFMKSKLGDKLSEEEYQEVYEAILWQRVLPSMRLMWSAGEAAEKNNASAYNCAYLTVDKIEKFSEALFLLTSGCGVGFSCERNVVANLPEIKPQTGYNKLPYVIPDSREGWADAVGVGLETWMNGYDIIFDYSLIRPEGSPLKTFGGRASGPAPLRRLLEFVKDRVLSAQGRKLKSIDVHDIMCMIGEVVIAGGTRRSALMSLSDLYDVDLMEAKQGIFPNYRFMSNNSAVHDRKPVYNELMYEWEALKKSGTGERGIFNRLGALESMPERREWIRNAGTNPCGEIVLRPSQLCNLSNVIMYPQDTFETIRDKVRIATLIGTFQSTLTNFIYLGEDWKKNCEEERLLGVSLTGIYDNLNLISQKNLVEWRTTAQFANVEFARRFGVEPSAAVTCIKPSGNTSQLTNSASGMHPRYAPYYLRRVRINAHDPLVAVLRERGINVVPEVGQTLESATTLVAEFPQAAPKNCVTRNDVTSLEQLELWLKLKDHFTEHTVSATIYVESDKWDDTGNWVWHHWDDLSGLAFLPKEDENTHYVLAPYEEISKDQYEQAQSKLSAELNTVQSLKERVDNTEGAGEYACVGGNCEL